MADYIKESEVEPCKRNVGSIRVKQSYGRMQSSQFEDTEVELWQNAVEPGSEVEPWKSKEELSSYSKVELQWSNAESSRVKQSYGRVQYSQLEL